ncbi:MAG TPA: hypothetical protein VGY56_03025 [Verrucomicrobiae bacterium]|nr:hypothetical protein [Verrucomicrobiae bacterium]
MKIKFRSLRRLSVDFENEPVCRVSIQRPRSEQSRARKQAEAKVNHVSSEETRSLTVGAQFRPLHRANGTSRFIVQNGKLELRSPRFNAVSQVALPPFQRFNAKSAFTLVEILVTLVLLSMIVLALMAVFSGIQRAFRASLTQTDTLEAGRAVMDLIANDMTTMTPSYGVSNIVFNGSGVQFIGPVNFAATLAAYSSPPSPLIQPLLSSSSGASRTNILENIFILSKANINGVPSWVATGYSVNTNLTDGTLYPLYRFYMTTNISAGPPALETMYYSFAYYPNYNNSTNWSHLMDGVVNLTARAYDTNGVWITNGYTLPAAYHEQNVFSLGSTLGPSQLWFFSNAVPASVQIEMATIEDHTLRHAESLAGVNQNSYLTNSAGQVHIFRQRVWIRNMDPTAYE